MRTRQTRIGRPLYYHTWATDLNLAYGGGGFGHLHE